MPQNYVAGYPASLFASTPYPAKLASSVTNENDGGSWLDQLVAEMDASFPHLGFDPAPGEVSKLETILRDMVVAGQALEAANGLYGRLATSDAYWQGDAATAFRSHLDSTLSADLAAAAVSVLLATEYLATWAGELPSYKERAVTLDAVAAELQTRYAAAYRAYQQASNDYTNNAEPLEGKTFATHSESDQAQAIIDVSAANLRSATSSIDGLIEQFNDVIAQAVELRTEVYARAEYLASELEDAASRFAPHKPGGVGAFIGSVVGDIMGGLGDVGRFIESHANVIGDIYSDMSAVFATLALCTPPPFDAACMVISGAESAAALGFHALGGADNLTSLSGVVGTAGDVLGIVGGVGAVGKLGEGADAAAQGLKAVAEGSDALAKASTTMVKVGDAFVSTRGVFAKADLTGGFIVDKAGSILAKALGWHEVLSTKVLALTLTMANDANSVAYGTAAVVGDLTNSPPSPTWGLVSGAASAAVGVPKK